MRESLEILRGELERLFTAASLKDLCRDFLALDAEANGLHDEAKAVFVRRLLAHCEKEHQIEALADALLFLKKGMVDPRLKQVFGARFDDDLAAGTRVGAYVVRELISAGGVGIVYRCEKEGSEGRYVLKVVRHASSLDAAAVNRFLTAMRYLAGAPAASLMPIDAVGRLADGRPWVAMGFVDGTPLTDLMPMPAPRALAIVEAILEALEVVYERGLVHGDLKVENVLARLPEDAAEAPAVTLLGLGLDRLFSRPEHDRSGAIGHGSPKCLAPELARGGAADARSDFYALGTLIFELVTGKAPFSGRSAADLVAAHLTQPPPRPSEHTDEAVPPALDDLVARLMAKDALQRPRALDELRKLVADTRRQADEVAARAAQTGTRDDIATWADGLIDKPGDEEILGELLAEAKRKNAWGAAVEVLEEAAVCTDDQAVGRRLLLKAAEASVRWLKDFEKAEAIYGQFLSADDNDLEIQDAMLVLLRAAGRYDELVMRLAARAELTEDAAAKMAIIRDIGAVYEKDLKDFAKAFDYYLATLGAGVDAPFIKKLETLAEKTGRFNDLVTSAAQIAAAFEGAGDLDTALLIYGRLGVWYLEHLDQPPYALACFQKVLQYRPGDKDALASVADLYRGAQQWSELAGVLSRLGEVETLPTASRDRLVEAAKITYERLSRSDDAVKLLEDVLAEDPGHEGASALMEAICEERGTFDKLAKLMAIRLDRQAGGDAAVAGRYRLGEIYEDRLDDLKAAREQYEKALELDGKHLDSIKGLERIFARQSDHAGLRDNLTRQLELAVTPRQKVLLLERLSEIHEEEFKDVSSAVSCFEQILAIDPEHTSALIALTRLFRKTERWEDLVSVLDKRAERAAGEDEKREFLKEKAEILREKIGDAQRAAAALQVVASMGGAEDALSTLAHTQEEAGDFAAAVATLEKLLGSRTENADKVELLVRIAKIQLDRIGDRAEAVATLRRAIDLDPKNRHVLVQLRQVYVSQGNFTAAVDTFDDELELVEGKLARAELFANKGLLLEESIKDLDRAVSCYELALEFDESCLVAADRVSTIYRQRGQWDKAMPIYKRWADAAESIPKEKRIELFSQLGEAHDRMGQRDEALKAFSRAADMAGEDPRLLRRLGEIALEVGEHKMARDELERYLKLVGDSLKPEERVDVIVLVGRACLGVDDVTEAAKLARQATVMAPEHAGARLLLADVFEKRGDWRGMVDACQRAIGSLDPASPERIPLLRRTASALFDKLKDADGAAKLLGEVLEQRGDDRNLLLELVKIYSATKRHEDTVKTLLRLARIIEDNVQRARYHFAAAKLYQRELKQPQAALEQFEQAITDDPGLDDAASSLVEMLTELKDWDRLEKHYKKLMAKVAKEGSTEEKLAVYEPLADLYAHKLDRQRDAMMVLEAIAKLEPEKIAWQERLAEIYGWTKDHKAKALAVHRRLLEHNPARAESFRTLFRIHSGDESPDEAWCAAAMLSLLNQASPEERKFYTDNKLTAPPAFQSRLKDDQWTKLVYHEDLQQTIAAIFAVVAPAIFRQKNQTLASFGLDPKKAIDVANEKSELAGMVRFAAGSLGLEAPKLFLHEGQGASVQLVDALPPSLVAGSTAQSVKDKQGLAFTLGRELTLLRPGLQVRKVVSSGSELSAWLMAAIKSFVPGLPVPSEISGAVSDRLAPLRESLDAAAWERLQGHVQAFLAKSPDVDLKKWQRAVDYTTDRAGLLLCGDVAVAVRMLKDELGGDKAALSDRLKALTLFMVSDKLARLREDLGVGLRHG